MGILSLSGLRTTGGADKMTCRWPSAESVPAEARALRRRGDERAFFYCGSASAANRREVGRKRMLQTLSSLPCNAATCTPSNPVERLSSPQSTDGGAQKGQKSPTWLWQLFTQLWLFVVV